MLAVFYWDPDRTLFQIPFIHHPIGWYGLLFATGFVLGYFILQHILKLVIQNNPQIVAKEYAFVPPNGLAQLIVDRISWYVVAGTILGARLGHVFFYDWSYYKAHPLAILFVWEGGLASHGGTVGLFIALCLFYRKLRSILPGLSFLAFFDLFCIPVPLGCFFIRLGNFFNQEILGVPTDLPWGVIFGHPMDGQANVPSHPAQLYEGIVYLLVFFVLLAFWKYQRIKVGSGLFFGFLFFSIFGSRFFIEYTKAHQNSILNGSSLEMGQWLSLPFIFAGIVLLIYSYRCKDDKCLLA